MHGRSLLDCGSRPSPTTSAPRSAPTSASEDWCGEVDPFGYVRHVIRVLLVSDTHLGAAQADRLVRRIPGALATADVIMHAGDIIDESLLSTLADFAEVHAVRGNNDVGSDLPEQAMVSIAGCDIAMVHDSGPATGRGARLHRWFPTADAVVFGHSHIPWRTTDVNATGHVQHQVNPGSAMQRRRQPHCTIGWIDIDDGRIVDVRHEVV
jgi:putative phosphoesterase